jgi:TPR repeat protein
MRRDPVEAVRLYRLSAEQGNARAQANLSNAYIKGEGVAVDYAEAMRWARLSADQGNAVGEYNVGLLYANGWGVSRDLRATTLWLSRAATRGHEQAKEGLLKLAADGVLEAVAAVQRLRLAP